jgi:predicted small secreted protein
MRVAGKSLGATAILIILLSAAAVLSACHTAEGLGQDVSAAGKAISNAAEKAKPN